MIEIIINIADSFLKQFVGVYKQGSPISEQLVSFSKVLQPWVINGNVQLEFCLVILAISLHFAEKVAFASWIVSPLKTGKLLCGEVV